MRRRNTYWLLRHGRSIANEQGIIVSIKANGIKPEFSLTEVGKEQAVAAGRELRQYLEAEAGARGSSPTLLVYSSPFSRTQLTARLAAGEVGINLDDTNYHVVDELCERYFGSALELQDHASHYAATWAQDEKDPGYRPGGDGETVEEVAGRVKKLVETLEQRHSGCHILLVAHGDTLSIGCAALQNTPLTQHRSHAFETAELRRLHDTHC